MLEPELLLLLFAVVVVRAQPAGVCEEEVPEAERTATPTSRGRVGDIGDAATAALTPK